MMVVGIDPHKQLYSLAALTPALHRLGARNFSPGQRSIPALARAMRDWAHAQAATASTTHILWAIEGGPGLGGRLADALLAHGQSVVWVPTPRMHAHRAMLAPTGAKSDTLDAYAVAAAAHASPDLAHHRLNPQVRELRQCVELRQDLLARHTQAINQLKAELHTHLAHTPGDLTRPKGRRLLATWLSTHAPSPLYADLWQLRLSEIAQLSDHITHIDAQLRPRVHQLAPTLLTIRGIGPLTAARLVASIGDITRFATPNQLARYSGCAPIPVFSSGGDRHRLHRGGNRQLNSAIHRIALTQARCHTPARTYLDSKTPTKGKRGALRALKRHLVTHIHRALTTDHHRHTHTLAA